MSKERCYRQPSCTLRVWWDSSTKLHDRDVPRSIEFCLKFSDNQQIEGNSAEFQEFIATVDSYIQNFLREDSLPVIAHSVRGLDLSSVQLVDASNAIAAFNGEVMLLPDRDEVRELSWANAFLRSLVVGLSALIFGAGLGLWLASRNNRTAPRVVVAPAPEVFSEPVISESPIPEPVIPQPPTLLNAPKSQKPQQKIISSPPIRVYPVPKIPETRAPVIPQLEPKSANKTARENIEPPANLPPKNSPQEGVLSASQADSVLKPLTISSVEISTSPELTQALIDYLRSVELPPGQVTLDITTSDNLVEEVTIENPASDNSEAIVTLQEVLKQWNPPQTGRVRLQVSIP